MKFVKETGKSDLLIPSAALSLSGLDEAKQMELHTLNDVVLLLKGEMTAMELITVIESLSQLSTELILHLISACGRCDGCEGDCPFGAEDNAIHLPKFLLEQADIPEGSALRAVAGPSKGAITVTAADQAQHGLSDIPPGVLETLTQCGICLGALNETLGEGSIIYGEA